jgi:hypothetical protein
MIYSTVQGLSFKTVQGLSFKRFKVCGEYIPSVRMIKGILNDRHTDEAKQQLSDISNEYCQLFEIECRNELPPDIPENKLKRQRIEIDRNFLGNNQAMSAITGHSFDKLVRYQYVMSWYQAVAGNSSGGNPQAVRKGKRPLDVNSKGEMERGELSLTYPDFREADDYFRGFYVSVASFYKAGNVKMINLSNRQDDIFKERAYLEEKIRKDGKKMATFFCKYCQKYHEFSTFKIRVHCGANECEKKADNSRNLIDRKGWVEDPDVRPKKCVMGGSRRVKLNSYRLCLQCHLELADCIKTFLV